MRLEGCELDPAADADEVLAHRYRTLRRLLAANSEMLELLADLEDDLWHIGPSDPLVHRPIAYLLDGSLLLAENLNHITHGRHRALYQAHHDIALAVRSYLAAQAAAAAQPLVVPLAEANRTRIAEVGGKAAHLGELLKAMPAAAPPGFVLTTAAYRLFLAAAGLRAPIHRLLENMSLIMERQLFRQRAAAIRELVEAAAVPPPVRAAIDAGVASLGSGAPAAWAVRSSAVGEDGALSFAGQFESMLGVPREGLEAAYKRVVASRWANRALAYRLIKSFSEAETPMAVVFLPMLEARAAGVLYSRDPRDPAAERMLVNATLGLADDLVSGRREGAALVIGRGAPHLIGNADTDAEAPPSPVADAGRVLSDADAAVLAKTALAVERHFGEPQDIEWVIGADGRAMIVQARPLCLEAQAREDDHVSPAASPLLHGGITVFPGRAIGLAHRADSTDDLQHVPSGAVLIVRQATPEVAAVLPALAGIIAEHGNSAGHAATLIREFRIPAVFGMHVPHDAVAAGQTVSLDAGGRRLFAGAAWPPAKERTHRHAPPARAARAQGALYERVLALNLVDPLASAFRAGKCRSIHDIVRFAHEKAVAAMFDLGDEVAGRGVRRIWRLDATVPLNLMVLDLGGAVPPLAKRKAVVPGEILCTPFQALWRGVTAPGVSWAGRVNVSVAGFGSVLSASMTDAWASLRGLGEHNYLLLAHDYLNLNARIGYHFAMIDGLITDAAENNFVNFRFRGGAAGAARRDLRARFLAEVLHRSGFNVDRRGDLVTAWIRRFPREESERGLALLGSLMGCARQLDMLVADDAAVAYFVERYLVGDYRAFA